MKDLVRRIALIGVIAIVGISNVFADKVENVPQTIKQADGEVIQCFTSGDEFYHWLHDANGYTIVLNSDDGNFYYGIQNGDEVAPSEYMVNTVDPATVNLSPGARISGRLYQERKSKYTMPFKSFKDAPTTGQVNNLVVYIAFADDSVIKNPRSYYKPFFSHEDSASLKDYFREVSYNRLFIDTYHYPISDDTTNIVYVDENPRGYYLKKSGGNPEGYSDGESGQREHAMMKRAIEFVDSQIPDTLNVDMNDDGRVDNVCFVMQGARAGWSDLLWPHRWSLYNEDARVNGKRVWDYLLMLEGGFGVGTLCHEFFHVLGAPDLYHYEPPEGTPTAVGKWDIMDSNTNPPQYMGAFMKYKYGDWISSLPEIRESGTYYLNPLSEPENNVYKVKSPRSPNEYFILEYRRREGRYESSAPGTGLVVYRINPNAGNGNAGGPPDEVYVYRPGGTLTSEGAISSAAFGLGDRRAINDRTDPSCYVYNNGNGGPGGLDVFNVGNPGDSIGFDIIVEPLYAPVDLTFVLGVDKVTLDWPTLYADGIKNYVVYRNGVRLNVANSSRYVDRNIEEGKNYIYTVTAVYEGAVEGESEPSNPVSVTLLGVIDLPYSEDFEEADNGWLIKGSVDGFRWGDAGSLGLNTDNESSFLGANSVAAGQNSHTLDYAISPRFNLAGQQEVILEFDYSLKVWQRFDKLTVKFRRSVSGSWIPIMELPKSGIVSKYMWRHMAIEIPAEAFTSETQIAFQYTDSNEFAYGAAIDNITLKSGTSGIEEIENALGLSVYPNPSYGKYDLVMDGNFEGYLPLKVVALNGREVLSGMIDQSGRLSLDLSNQADGIYQLLLETPSKTVNRKLVKISR